MSMKSFARACLAAALVVMIAGGVVTAQTLPGHIQDREKQKFISTTEGVAVRGTLASGPSTNRLPGNIRDREYKKFKATAEGVAVLVYIPGGAGGAATNCLDARNATNSVNMNYHSISNIAWLRNVIALTMAGDILLDASNQYSIAGMPYPAREVLANRMRLGNTNTPPGDFQIYLNWDDPFVCYSGGVARIMMPMDAAEGLSVGDTNINSVVTNAAIIDGLITEDFTWTYNGQVDLATTMDGYRVVSRDCVITDVWITMTERGGTGTTIVDVNSGTIGTPWTTQQNGVSLSTLYTSQANRPSITGSGGSPTQNAFKLATDPDTTSLSAGDILAVDIDDKGNGDGKYLTITVRVRYL